jgi:hypothetical protein
MDYSASHDAKDPPVTGPDDTPDLDTGSGPAAEASYEALARLAAMLARGQSEERLIAESAAIITAWALALEADDMRERLAEMLDQLGDAQALAEDQGSEIEEADAASRRRHEQKLGKLRAMYDAFARAADAMP